MNNIFQFAEHKNQSFLVGTYRTDKEQLPWILGIRPNRRELLYNVRYNDNLFASRNGGVIDATMPDYVLLYDYKEPARGAHLFTCLSSSKKTENEMIGLHYPKPNGSYMIFHLGEELSCYCINVNALLENIHRLNPNRDIYSPSIITGDQLEAVATHDIVDVTLTKNRTPLLVNICHDLPSDQQTITTDGLKLGPMIKYRGGKSKEIPHILNHIPPFSGRYIEPFLGGGALYFYLNPKKAIINDINAKLIAFYRGVSNHYESLRVELDAMQAIYEKNRKAFDARKLLHPNEHVEDANEQTYYHIRDMYNGLIPNEYSEALVYYFINKTAYSGMIRYNAKGEYNVPFGRYPHFNTNTITQQHATLLQRSEIMCGDYRKVFDLTQPNDFIFLDPPYDCVFSDYGNEEYKTGFGVSEHERLAVDFRNLPCPALLVIGKTPLTESLYGDLIIDEYDKTYAVNIRNRFRSEAKHILVSNYGRL